ncbi:hypothetical protein BKA61DRAFT_14766 [Leptodontidium sp. MPI-SDFR-AT-0119]|nr:hypothetical protein BKA61DRAFT_14766 [Leptodontidium sp. MPI-SDFR-AT-0119]
MLPSHSSWSVAGSATSTLGLGSISGSISTRESRSRPRFPRASLRLLEEWLSAHRQSPYPTPGDLDHLMAVTRLKRSQISNWFANVRKRGKVPSLEPVSPPQGEAIPPTIPASKKDEDVPLFHRWLNSWTDDEAAALPAILEAVSQLNGASSGEFLRGSTRFHRQFCPSQSSLSSMEVRSYAANAKSVHSDEWKTSDDVSTAPTQSKRRHRRLPVNVDSCSCSGVTDQQAASRKFQCTFCSDRFKTKYDWQRHEKSIHLPLEKWTCSPYGSVDVEPTTNQVTCTFCGIVDPTPEHIGAHGYTSCATRPVAERTFYRKDHLRQHLRLMHGNCPLIPSMGSWKTVNTIRSRCGFCDASLNTWDDRVEHLAEHFCDGLSVARDWVGGWGFDDRVSSMLERASLPGESGKAKENHDFTAPSRLNSTDYAQSVDMESFFDTQTLFDCQYQDVENFDPAFSWDVSMPVEAGFSTFNPARTYEKVEDGEILALPFSSLPLDGLESDLFATVSKSFDPSTESQALDFGEISSLESCSASPVLSSFDGAQFF